NNEKSISGSATIFGAPGKCVFSLDRAKRPGAYCELQARKVSLTRAFGRLLLWQASRRWSQLFSFEAGRRLPSDAKSESLQSTRAGSVRVAPSSVRRTYRACSGASIASLERRTPG